MTKGAAFQLWARWVGANALGELIGLGTTFAVGFASFSAIGEPGSALAAVGSGLLMVAAGAIEGLVVGLAQWWAMREGFPSIRRGLWVVATLVGALTAWFLGSIPSTVMSLGGEGAGTPAAEPPTWLVLLLAALMGAVLGIVLALPQWFVLRRSVPRAAWWLPANSAAWLLGMAIIFAAVDLAFGMGSPVGAVLAMGLALALTGAVVGAVHGLVLVRLASGQREVAAFADQDHYENR
jgi:hypothetical protein